MPGSRPYNLKRHVKNKHPDCTAQIIENNRLTIVTKESILNAWAEIVTINGRPFTTLHDLGIEQIMKMLITLSEQKSGKKINISVDKIQNRVCEISREIKNQIIIETKNQLILMALDICTKNHRVILGINIQYILNGNIVVRTIGMPCMNQSHTAKNVAEMVKSSLNSFEISLKQIYCVTTDNAPYMLLCSDVLESMVEDDNCDLNQNQIEEEFFRRILKEAVEDYFEQPFADYVYNLPCGVHSFQLAIKDALAVSTIASRNIEHVRSIVKKMRTPTVIRVMKDQNLSLPVLDNDTRWDGKYSMVRSEYIFTEISNM